MRNYEYQHIQRFLNIFHILLYRLSKFNNIHFYYIFILGWVLNSYFVQFLLYSSRLQFGLSPMTRF